MVAVGQRLCCASAASADPRPAACQRIPASYAHECVARVLHKSCRRAAIALHQQTSARWIDATYARRPVPRGVVPRAEKPCPRSLGGPDA